MDSAVEARGSGWRPIVVARHRANLLSSGVWLAVTALVVAGVVYATLSHPGVALVQSNALTDATAAVVSATVGWLLVSRRRGRALGPLFLCIGLSGALAFASNEYASWVLSHAHRGPAANWAAWIGSWVWIPDLALAPTLILAFFPEGQPRSPRWRLLSISACGSLVVLMAVVAALPGEVPSAHPGARNPLAVGHAVVPALAGMAAPAVGVVAVTILAGVVSLLRRWRRATGSERAQLSWFLGGAVVAVLAQLPGTPDVLNLVGASAIAVAVGVAVLRHRLYEMDLVLNRALVYVALTAGVVAVYAVAVGVLGSGLGGRGDVVSSILAAAVVAVAFQPARDRVQRWVDRSLYGESRRDPLGAVSMLGRQLSAETTEGPLGALAATVATALRLPYVAILDIGGVEIASFGQQRWQTTTLGLDYQGEAVGSLVVSARGPNEALGPRDLQLLDTLAPQIATAAHAVRLTNDLQRSRQRLVVAREEERRRLRRDLHDGLGPTLAGLALGLEAAHDSLDTHQDHLKNLLARLQADAGASVSDIRRIVDDLRPAALDDLGLLSALRERAATLSSARSTGLSIHVQAPTVLPELSAALEVAAFRIVTEAMTNVTRHARATTCVVRLSAGECLLIEVTDDGTGFDPRLLKPNERVGVGLTSIQERADEMGGSVEVHSCPELGTTVLARLPIAPR